MLDILQKKKKKKQLAQIKHVNGMNLCKFGLEALLSRREQN